MIELSDLNIKYSHRTISLVMVLNNFSLQLKITAVFLSKWGIHSLWFLVKASTNRSGVNTNLSSPLGCVVQVDVCSMPIVWNNIPQHATSPAIILLWLPDMRGLPPTATRHTPLLLMVCVCVCVHEGNSACVLSVCLCVYACALRVTRPAGGTWLIQDSAILFVNLGPCHHNR